MEAVQARAGAIAYLGYGEAAPSVSGGEEMMQTMFTGSSLILHHLPDCEHPLERRRRGVLERGRSSLTGVEADDRTLTYPPKSTTAKTMVSCFVATSACFIEQLSRQVCITCDRVHIGVKQARMTIHTPMAPPRSMWAYSEGPQ